MNQQLVLPASSTTIQSPGASSASVPVTAGKFTIGLSGALIDEDGDEIPVLRPVKFHRPAMPGTAPAPMPSMTVPAAGTTIPPAEPAGGPFHATPSFPPVPPKASGVIIEFLDDEPSAVHRAPARPTRVPRIMQGLAAVAGLGATYLLTKPLWRLLGSLYAENPGATGSQSNPPIQSNIPSMPDTTPASADSTGMATPEIVTQSTASTDSSTGIAPISSSLCGDQQDAFAIHCSALTEQSRQYGQSLYNGIKAVPEALIKAACKHPVIAATAAIGSTAVIVGSILAYRYGFLRKFAPSAHVQAAALPEKVITQPTVKPYATWTHAEKAALYSHALTLVRHFKATLQQAVSALANQHVEDFQQSLNSLQAIHKKLKALFALTSHTASLAPVDHAFTFVATAATAPMPALEDSYVLEEKALQTFERRLEKSLATHAQVVTP